MKIDLSCPVENRGTTVKTNNESGEPYALFQLFNLSDKVVSSVKLFLHAYDSCGKELCTIHAELAELDGQPKSYFAIDKGVSLAEAPEAKQVVAELSEVVFSDGEVYTVSEENMTEVHVVQPQYDEITRLKSVAGEDALCYAADYGPYWLCVCERANKQEDALCIRCGREKQLVLSRFSSCDQINQFEAEKQEELLRLAQIKKKKRNKILGISGIAVAVAAVLALLVWLTYGAVIGSMAAGKATEGNYLEAYKMYKSIGSEDIKTVSEKVKGNSFINLMQSGIMTADEENFYYLTDPMLCTIVKENKATGEVTPLGEAAGLQLSICGDWLYYVDAETMALSRVKTDGSMIEGVSDEPMGFYMIVGSDMYYLKAETIPAVDETQQATQQNTLWHMDLESKVTKKISDAKLGMLELYGGKVYYTDVDNDYKLCVMDADGKNPRVLVDVPVSCFAIAEDMIYYVDATVNDETMQPKLLLTSVALDGKTDKTVVDDRMVNMVGADGGCIYYSTYEDGAMYLKNIKTEQLTELNMGGAILYNIMDGYILTADMSGNLVKSSFDGSDSKIVYAYEAPSAE